MNETADRIYRNGNWRADAGKSAEQVAEEMNAARRVLRTGSNFTLLGLSKLFGIAFTAEMEFRIRSAVAAAQAKGVPEDSIQAYALLQMLQMLTTSTGPDFGLPEVQEQLHVLEPIIGADAANALRGLGTSRLYDLVSDKDVADAWAYLAERFDRETLTATVSRAAQELSSLLDDAAAFAESVAALTASLGS